MTKPAYYRDAYLATLDSEITSCGIDDGRPWAETADTIFYPEGGGQPADRGTLAGIQVTQVETIDGIVRHFLEKAAEPGPAHLEIDWRRRFDHMQQHTGQHLLTAIAADAFGWATTAFHLGETVSDVELTAPRLKSVDLRNLEDRVNEAILAALPVSAHWVDLNEYEMLEVRSRGLPDDHSGDVRLVEIEGLDLNTCGGTHLRSTAELGSLCVLGTEALRGGTRVFFVAGNRVRSRLAEHERRTAQLRKALDAPNEQLAHEAERRGAEIKAMSKRVRVLQGRLAEAEAARLAACDEFVIFDHWPDEDMAFLQTIARKLSDARPTGIALLTAGADDQGFFIVVSGEASGLDIAAVGGKISEVLHGRGGGRGAIFQGKATRLDRRQEAAARLKELTSTRSG